MRYPPGVGVLFSSLAPGLTNTQCQSLEATQRRALRIIFPVTVARLP